MIGAPSATTTKFGICAFLTTSTNWPSIPRMFEFETAAITARSCATAAAAVASARVSRGSSAHAWRGDGGFAEFETG